ncbi:hypothetical protein ACLKA6_004558 [Drosophila palustris]
MARGSREYTAFTVPGRGLFHWKVMPFGLHSAPATFQRALDSVIGPDMEPYAFAYLDDIIVSGASLEEHVRNLGEVLRRLRQANLRLNRAKCKFFRRSRISQDPIPETPVAVPPSSAINLKNKLLANNNNNKNSNAAATNVAPGNNNMNNNNNNNNNSQPNQQSTPSDLEAFFSEQRRIMEDQQQQRKQQQKWNLIKSTKIPTLFLPKVEQIQPLLDRLDKLEGVTNGYNTKCTQNGAIRLHCSSMEIYQKISTELNNDNTELHTHQLRRERGYRIPHQPMQPQQAMQHHKQQKQQKHQQQQQQQHTPIKGNNSKLGQRPTYSQVAKSGNNNSSINKPQAKQQKASGPASRHLSAFQNKLRAEKAQKKQQQEQQQQQQQQIGQQLGQQHELQHDLQLPTDDCLSLAIMQNTHTIALMGEKMDAMLDIIRDMLSRLLPVTPQKAQQQHQHIEPIVRIASANPNGMSVDSIVFGESSSQSKIANDNGNE